MTKQEQRAAAEHPAAPHLAHLAARSNEPQQPTAVKGAKAQQAGCDITVIVCPKCRVTFATGDRAGQVFCSCGTLLELKE